MSTTSLQHRLMEAAEPAIREDMAVAAIGETTHRWSSPELTYRDEVKLTCTLEEISEFNLETDYRIGSFREFHFAADIVARIDLPEPDGIPKRAVCYFQIWHER